MKRKENLPYPIILLIDTAEREQTAVALITAGISPKIEAQNSRAQKLPVLIDQLLISAKILPASVKAVAIVKRDGSVTAIRIGTAVANTFAWLNRLPIIEVSASGIDEAVKKIRHGQIDRVAKVSRPLS
ncbi:MAG: hypothetical protein WD970_00870 [Patescibacteria group bacterium]